MQYQPEITLNHGLLDTLSDEQKQEWVDADPRKTFRYNPLTRRVGRFQLLWYMCAAANWGTVTLVLSLGRGWSSIHSPPVSCGLETRSS